MSRAQGIRSLLIGEQSVIGTGTFRIDGKGLPRIGAHRLRCEPIRQGVGPADSEFARTALSAIGHRP